MTELQTKYRSASHDQHESEFNPSNNGGMRSTGRYAPNRGPSANDERPGTGNRSGGAGHRRRFSDEEVDPPVSAGRGPTSMNSASRGANSRSRGTYDDYDERDHDSPHSNNRNRRSNENFSPRNYNNNHRSNNNYDDDEYDNYDDGRRGGAAASRSQSRRSYDEEEYDDRDNRGNNSARYNRSSSNYRNDDDYEPEDSHNRRGNQARDRDQDNYRWDSGNNTRERQNRSSSNNNDVRKEPSPRNNRNPKRNDVLDLDEGFNNRAKSPQSSPEKGPQAVIPPPIVTFTHPDLTDMRKFLRTPLPKSHGIVQCYIKRNKSGTNKLYPVYSLYLKVRPKLLRVVSCCGCCLMLVICQLLD